MNARRTIRRFAFAFATFAIALVGVVPQPLVAGGKAFAMRCSVAVSPDGPCCCGGSGKCPKGCCRAAEPERTRPEGIPPKTEESTIAIALPAPLVAIPPLAGWTATPRRSLAEARVPASPTLLSLSVRFNA